MFGENILNCVITVYKQSMGIQRRERKIWERARMKGKKKTFEFFQLLSRLSSDLFKVQIFSYEIFLPH